MRIINQFIILFLGIIVASGVSYAQYEEECYYECVVVYCDPYEDYCDYDCHEECYPYRYASVMQPQTMMTPSSGQNYPIKTALKSRNGNQQPRLRTRTGR